MGDREPVQLRSQPADVGVSDVKNMLEKYSFYSKSVGWNREFCNEDGDFQNDLHDNTDGTVTDRATGLMWQQDSAPIYTRWNGAKLYIERLNVERFAGYSDWRLPTIEELASLIEREQRNNDLYINPIFTDKMWFWSSDRTDANPEIVWTANFHYGAVYWLDTNQGQDVKAVRSLPTAAPVLEANKDRIWLRSQPADVMESDVRAMLRKYGFYSKNIEWNQEFCNEDGDFQNDLHDNGNGTVTDKATGLMWQRGSAPNYMRWGDAKRYAERVNKERFAGYSDWRLPTIEEFASLMERQPLNDGLYIDPVFSNRMWFWSIDTKGAGSGMVWTANFHYGTVFVLEANQGHDARVVRSLT